MFYGLYLLFHLHVRLNYDEIFRPLVAVICNFFLKKNSLCLFSFIIFSGASFNNLLGKILSFGLNLVGFFFHLFLF